MNYELRIMLFKKVIPALFIILASLFMIQPVHAQTLRLADARSGPSASPSILPTSNFQPQYPTSNFQLPTYIPPTSPLYTDLLVNNLFHSFSCLAVGQSVIGQPCLTYQISQNAQGVLQGVPYLSSVNTTGGVLGTTTSLIGALYTNPPVRTADYLASVSKSFGAKEAQAQVVGSGQAVLNPILGLWQTSRNISYVIMIIIFLIIGLMVMFRSKINPQTVITAQAAIPGLVVGLILITFSYFLAGLVSDMAFVGTNVVGYYFVAAQGKIDVPATDPDQKAWQDQLNLVQKLSDKNVLSIFSPFVGILDEGKISNILGIIMDKLDTNAQFKLRTLAGLLTAQFTGPMFGAIPPPLGLWVGPTASLLSGIAVGAAPTFFLSFVFSFVATLALIYQMLKLLLRLLSAYLTIIFLTISAPFQFLAAALPGRQGIATGWILSILGNVLIFPAVLAVFYFVAFLLGSSNPSADIFKTSNLNHINNTFVPSVYAEGGTEITGRSNFPLLGGIYLSFVRILLAFGALMALPSIPDIVMRSIGKVSQAGQLIGQEIGGGVGQGQRYAGQYQSATANVVSRGKQSLFGEQGMTYNPLTGKYEPGLTKAGYFNYKPRAITGTTTPPDIPTGGVR